MIPLLDHGYLNLVESWGSDESIIEAARMSTGKGFLGWGGTEPCEKCKGEKFIPSTSERRGYTCDKCDGRGTKAGDEKLLRYLYENKHHTPFEMAGLIIEVKAPIMVFREWHRHRTQSFNEMSGRYIALPDENYIPSVERLMINAKAAGGNKQAGTIKGAADLTEFNAEWFRTELEGMYQMKENLYQQALKVGVPKELARVHLPVGRYSRMRASANLRNWLGFLTLRMDPSAQWEIRQYANALGTIIQEKFPRTWALFQEHA